MAEVYHPYPSNEENDEKQQQQQQKGQGVECHGNENGLNATNSRNSSNSENHNSNSNSNSNSRMAQQQAAPPDRIQPWRRPPTIDSVQTTKRRIEWVEAEMSRLERIDEEQVQRLRSEWKHLTSWKTVAEYHLMRALNYHQKEMFAAFQPHLDVRQPTIANRFLNGREYEVLLDGVSHDHFTFERLLVEGGSEAERRSIWKSRFFKHQEQQQQQQQQQQGNGGEYTRCVVKIIQKNHGSIKKDPMYYQREFIAQTIVGGFGHPNILPLHRYYENEDQVFASLPYVPTCLFDLVSNNYPYTLRGLDEAIIQRLFPQMLTSVRFLSNLGLVHRDLSLENFVLNDNGVLQLIDFGLCTPMQLQDTTSGKWAEIPSTFAGKLYYMAPEVFHASNQPTIDAVAADVWSLGVCLFVLLCGVYPFQCPNHTCDLFTRLEQYDIASVIRQHMKMGEVSNKLSCGPELLDLLDRLLKIDPAERITLDEIKLHPFVFNV